MQNEKPSVQLLVSFCPVCGSRLICGEAVKRGLMSIRTSWTMTVSSTPDVLRTPSIIQKRMRLRQNSRQHLSQRHLNPTRRCYCDCCKTLKWLRC